jgi:NADH dehydrogenase/NADH:ubiquinone oxidoreductase subunit G
MNEESEMRLTVDGVELTAREGASVLEAAQENNIAIPHLCSHRELAPYGGCRLCIVEIDGIAGFPTACTTLALNGMVVRTKSQAVQEMRRDVLQLMLSEHPASCLVCDEEEECSSFQGTIRKVGVTTGCRFCPNDGSCELQDVARQVGLKELSLPINYRGYPVENLEEFYDRDYNLCIHCARCVRVCQEYRKTGTLSFRQRGPLTTIGPAFNMTHRDAGCEFCGACISVCPTGALSEKGRKWSGTPERLLPSVCPLCSLHCDIQAAVKNGSVIGTLPPGIPGEAAGDLCVKGRFCLGELSNHPDRILTPSVRSRDGVEELDWNRACTIAAEKLGGAASDRIAVYVSPDLLLEDMVMVQRLARVLETENITSSVIGSKTSSAPCLKFSSAAPSALASSDCIVTIFFNGNYGYAPVTLGIKRGVEQGAKYYQIGWLADTTSRFAERRISPRPEEAASILQDLVRAVTNTPEVPAEIKELGEALKAARQPVFVLGMNIADFTYGDSILDSVEKLVQLTRAKVIAPNPYGNLNGIIRTLKIRPKDEVGELIATGKIDALYLIGDCPFIDRPPVNTIIYQNPFPPPPELAPDLVLPAAFWGEVSGSLIGQSGDRKAVQAAIPAPGAALQDGEIISQILGAMGKDLVAEVEEQTTLLGAGAMISRGHLDPMSKAPNLGEASRFTLVREINPHRYRDLSLSALIGGMSHIAPEDRVLIHPQTAQELGVTVGAAVRIQNGAAQTSCPVIVDRKVAPGFLYLIASPNSGGPCSGPVRIVAGPGEQVHRS